MWDSILLDAYFIKSNCMQIIKQVPNILLSKNSAYTVWNSVNYTDKEKQWSKFINYVTQPLSYTDKHSNDHNYTILYIGCSKSVVVQTIIKVTYSTAVLCYSSMDHKSLYFPAKKYQAPPYFHSPCWLLPSLKCSFKVEEVIFSASRHKRRVETWLSLRMLLNVILPTG